MGIDVIRPVLRVVLDDEDGGLRPEFRAANGLDDLTERQIVVGQIGGGGRFAEGGAGGVIVGKRA